MHIQIEDFFTPDKIYITCAVLAIVFFFLVSVLAGITTRRRQREAMDRCHYRPRRHLMVGDARRCFQLLNDLFGEKFYVIPDVSIPSLLSHKVGLQDRYTAYRFIENKTVDFVLCNKRTLRPICAVKLDDESHYDKSDPGSDPKNMEKFFKSAHIPFIRIPKTEKITRENLIEHFSRVIYETSLLKPPVYARKKSSAKKSKSVSVAPSQSTQNRPDYL